MNTSGSMQNTGADIALDVTAAAIVRQDKVLLARRDPSRDQGGLWEFPGGKREPGENREAALTRELDEELGIIPTRMRPLITVRHAYPHLTVRLDVWQVDAFNGQPSGREGQPVAWFRVRDLDAATMPAANRPIIRALGLPDSYLITPEDVTEAGFRSALTALPRGQEALLQLRCPGDFLRLARLASAAREMLDGGVRWLVNADPADAIELGAHGVHLSSARLNALEERPLPPEYLVGASCHNATELHQAAAVGADFAVLSPVLATPHRPGVVPLDWHGFAGLVEEVAMPVYALGGVGPGDRIAAWQAGGQGIAGIRGLWPIAKPGHEG